LFLVILLQHLVLIPPPLPPHISRRATPLIAAGAALTGAHLACLSTAPVPPHARAAQVGDAAIAEILRATHEQEARLAAQLAAELLATNSQSAESYMLSRRAAVNEIYEAESGALAALRAEQEAAAQAVEARRAELLASWTARLSRVRAKEKRAQKANARSERRAGVNWASLQAARASAVAAEDAAERARADAAVLSRVRSVQSNLRQLLAFRAGAFLLTAMGRKEIEAIFVAQLALRGGGPAALAQCTSYVARLRARLRVVAAPPVATPPPVATRQLSEAIVSAAKAPPAPPAPAPAATRRVSHEQAGRMTAAEARAARQAPARAARRVGGDKRFTAAEARELQLASEARELLSSSNWGAPAASAGTHAVKINRHGSIRISPAAAGAVAAAAAAAAGPAPLPAPAATTFGGEGAAPPVAAPAAAAAGPASLPAPATTTFGGEGAAPPVAAPAAAAAPPIGTPAEFPLPREDAAPALTAAATAWAREMFQRADRNGDGAISVKELMLALRHDDELAAVLHLPSHVHQEDGTRDAFERVFAQLDGDASRAITWPEFASYLTGVAASQGGDGGEQSAAQLMHALSRSVDSALLANSAALVVPGGSLLQERGGGDG
jgi:hypothetical protein